MYKRLFLDSTLALMLLFTSPRAFSAEAVSTLPTTASNIPILQAEIKRVQEKGSTSQHTSIVVDEAQRMIGCVHNPSASQEKILPVQKFHFTAQQALTSAAPVIIIDRISGMNTPEAHRAGQSEAKYVSSPTVVKINGWRVGYIYTDTEDYHLPIPTSVLRQDGLNTIELEAGFFFLPGDVLSYDEIHFQNISVEY